MSNLHFFVPLVVQCRNANEEMWRMKLSLQAKISRIGLPEIIEIEKCLIKLRLTTEGLFFDSQSIVI